MRPVTAVDSHDHQQGRWLAATTCRAFNSPIGPVSLGIIAKRPPRSSCEVTQSESQLLLLKAVIGELESSGVLRDSPDDIIWSAIRNHRFDFQCHSQVRLNYSR